MRELGPGRLYREQRGRRQWVLDYQDARGRRRRKALGTDRRVAEKLRFQVISERDAELTDGGAQNGDLADLRDAYLEDLELHVSPRHLLNVRGKLQRTLTALEATSVADLTPIAVVRFRNALVGEGLGHRTANAYPDALRAMLTWAVDNGLTPVNPILRIKRLPEGAKHVRLKRRAMTEAEIERFLAAAEEDDQRCVAMFPTPRIPQAPLWRAFLETGARYGELRLASWGDVETDRRLLHLRAETTKAGRPRSIPLGERLVEDLEGLRFAHHRVLGRKPARDEKLFLTPDGKPGLWHTSNLRRIFLRLLDAAGIEKVDDLGAQLDIHSLRHTFATRLARANVSLAKAQRLLGHSDPKLTAKVYTHVEAEDLRDAVASLGTEPGRRGVDDEVKEAT